MSGVEIARIQKDVPDYTIGDHLGRGSFATVYLATDKKDGKQYALKVIDKAKVPRKDRLENEVEALTKAHHPNIVCLHKMIDTESELMLVVDLCDGGELFDYLVDNGPFKEFDACVIVKQMLSAAAYMHNAGIVHRDLKPENILLVSKQRPNEIRISDFGIVKLFEGKVGRKANVQAFSHVGSGIYMAPEIIRGEGYDYSVDMWSIGVIMYILLSGYQPFSMEDYQRNVFSMKPGRVSFTEPVWNNISISAKNLISQLLNGDAYKRPSANEALNHAWIKQLKTGNRVQ